MFPVSTLGEQLQKAKPSKYWGGKMFVEDSKNLKKSGYMHN